MLTTRGRLTALRASVLITVVCAVTNGCSGRAARSVDRFYGIVNSPAADGKLVSIDVRDQNTRSDCCETPACCQHDCSSGWSIETQDAQIPGR